MEVERRNLDSCSNYVYLFERGGSSGRSLSVVVSGLLGVVSIIGRSIGISESEFGVCSACVGAGEGGDLRSQFPRLTGR